MKRSFIVLLCVSAFIQSHAQSPEELLQQANAAKAQQLENRTENNKDAVPEDDSYLQESAQWIRNPIDLNTADKARLQSLHFLSALQVQNFLLYRSRLGKLISIYELQAVPGWDISTIEKIRHYVTAGTGIDIFTSLKKRLRHGNHLLLVRASQTLERSKGYLIGPAAGKSYYTGSPQKILLRYSHQYKDLLQYGVLGEKDPGESFFRGAQKAGFDFYSAHFFVRRLGIIKSLAIGDYTVNMGQGLIQWMSLAFQKGPDISLVKRESDVLRPYHSSGEINFHRGAGITLAKKRWEATAFASYRRVDANFATGDSSNVSDDHVTSLQTSGYHRTPGEIADKGSQRQLALGGNISYQFRKLHLGLNAVHYQFKYPLIKQPGPYNLYALSGKSFGNYSTDYSFTYRNFHVFGEAAFTNKKYPAFLNGLLISVAPNADMSLVYRHISKNYQSLYSNAFTENSSPNNESGLFTGITLRPAAAWRVDAYADLYRFPWLKYRVNKPATGADYMLQLTYKPNKVLEIYTRYRSGKKSIDYNPDGHTLNPVVPQPREDWRVQVSYKFNSFLTAGSRAEVNWFDQQGRDAESGFLINADLLYHPPLKKYSGNMRLQYFETDGYNSRLYAYEDDVLYNNSIPVLYGTGYRYYININYDITKKLSLWAKCSQFIYPGQKTISSYLDEIRGSHKTGISLQVLFKF